MSIKEELLANIVHRENTKLNPKTKDVLYSINADIVDIEISKKYKKELEGIDSKYCWFFVLEGAWLDLTNPGKKDWHMWRIPALTIEEINLSFID